MWYPEKINLLSANIPFDADDSYVFDLCMRTAELTSTALTFNDQISLSAMLSNFIVIFSIKSALCRSVCFVTAICMV